MSRRLDAAWFDRDACAVARDLLSCELRRRWRGLWLTAVIVETEAYYRDEKASHASLGRTRSREAAFMAPGTIYMYRSQAGPSLNVSVRGEGAAVLIKGADPTATDAPLEAMHALNPGPRARRPIHRLCAGQALLCRALGLGLEWTGRPFDDDFHIVAGPPVAALQTKRLGIPPGRDEHLPYRFVHTERSRSATRNPLTRRAPDFVRLSVGAAVGPVHGGSE